VYGLILRLETDNIAVIVLVDWDFVDQLFVVGRLKNNLHSALALPNERKLLRIVQDQLV